MLIERKAALTRPGGVQLEVALVMVFMTTFVFGIF